MTSRVPYDAISVFRSLARFNERSNRDLFEALDTLSANEISEERGSWFGSILGILNHLIVTDIYWLRRFQALAPDSVVLHDDALSPPGLKPNVMLFHDYPALRLHRRRVDTVLRDWLDAFSGDRLDERFDYEDSSGIACSAIAGRAFEFLFVHQTHHRGAIVQILDTIGVETNVLDNMRYLEE